MFNLLCSFSVSRDLSIRDFNEYLSAKDIRIEKWYDYCGNITSLPTSLPVASYMDIFRWLFDNDIFIIITPIANSSQFMGRIYEYSELTDEKGKHLMRPSGGYSIGASYEETYAMTMRRAILELPIKESDDDLPF